MPDPKVLTTEQRHRERYLSHLENGSRLENRGRTRVGFLTKNHSQSNWRTSFLQSASEHVLQSGHLLWFLVIHCEIQPAKNTCKHGSNGMGWWNISAQIEQKMLFSNPLSSMLFLTGICLKNVFDFIICCSNLFSRDGSLKILSKLRVLWVFSESEKQKILELEHCGFSGKSATLRDLFREKPKDPKSGKTAVKYLLSEYDMIDNRADICFYFCLFCYTVKIARAKLPANVRCLPRRST